MDTRKFQFLGAVLELMEGNFQARGLTTLEGLELCSTNRVVYFFQIRPCETQVRSMHLTNSFMYRKKKDYHRCLQRSWLGVPHRDLLLHISSSCSPPRFEIIHRAHFPPTLVSFQFLESSLGPNWLPPMDTMADEWDLMKEWAFWYSKKNEAFDPS